MLAYLKAKFESWRTAKLEKIRKEIASSEWIISQCQAEMREGVAHHPYHAPAVIARNQDDISWLRSCERFYQTLAIT
jgi:hypothetical protein